MLQNKIAVIYGAGAIGTAVAQAFVKEGAQVFLASRSQKRLDEALHSVQQEGGSLHTAIVDALDRSSVEEHLKIVIAKAGRIDISFNAISTNDVQGNALREMSEKDFISPITTAVHTQFITATGAVRYMAKQGSGVVLAITANVARKPYTHSGGFGVSCAAVEGFCRQLAVEEGVNGIRVVCMRSAGSPDAPEVARAIKQHADKLGISAEAFENNFAGITMLKRLPRLAEIASTAVIMASDRASAITAAVINVTCGEIAD